MTFPYGRTVVAYREVRDEFGDITRGDQVTLEGVAIAPRTSSGGLGGTESTLDRRMARVESGLTLYVPDGNPRITSQHRIVLDDGTDWGVTGEPGYWSSPFTGWTPGYQVELDRVEG